MIRGSRRAAAASAILLLAAASASAASRYSLRGEGEPVLPLTSDVRAMGGAEAAGSIPALGTNPATLALAQKTRFYGSWLTDWVRTEETLPDAAPVRKEYEGYVPGLGLVFPMPGRVRLGTGILVDRRAEGRIIQAAEAPDGQDYRQVFQASGNLLRIPVIAARDWSSVQVGAGLDVVLQSAELRWRNDFPDGTAFLDSNDRDDTSGWGVAWRGGVRVPLGSRVALGAWTFRPGGLSGKRTLENDAAQDSTSALRVDFETDTAARYGLGADVRPFGALRVAADWTRESWEGVDAPRTVGTFVDVDRFSVGAEWLHGAEGSLQAPVRAGFRTEPLHTLDGHGREVRESAFSAGTGFAFADGHGRFDTFLEYGWRGTRGESEYYEQFVRFGMTLTGLEDWAGRRAPESDTEDW